MTEGEVVGNNLDDHVSVADLREQTLYECETEGCSRKGDCAIRYTVWEGYEGRIETRSACQPCVNAMRFRETFETGNDSWSVTVVR